MKLLRAFFVLVVVSAIFVLFKPAAVSAEQEDDSGLAEQVHASGHKNQQQGPQSWLADKKGVYRDADSSRDKKSDMIAAEVASVLGPNEIEVNMLGKKQVIKLAGIKDCPCDFNEQATKMARAETKVSKGFTVVDAGTIVKRCREIKDYLRDNTKDEVLIKLSGTHKDSFGRLTGVIRNKGESKTLNDAVLAYAQKQHAIEKKNNDHHTYKKLKAKNG
jgi:hypothetical protein